MAEIPNRGPELRGVAIFALVIAVISMILRCFSRLYMTKLWKIEDWLMIHILGKADMREAATLSFIKNVTTCLIGVHYGTGRHIADVYPPDASKALMVWWLCYLSYATTMIFCKTSIAIFLLRITPNKVHRWIIYAALFITNVTGIAFFFIALFQCEPRSHFWNPQPGGRCINIEAIITITYTYSAASVITDFTFALLPIHIVWSLQMDKKTKVVLIPIFAMACIASIAVVMRMIYVPKFREPDFLWNTLEIAIWSELEQGLAIAAGNLATLRPLFRLTVEYFSILTGYTTRVFTKRSLRSNSTEKMVTYSQSSTQPPQSAHSQQKTHKGWGRKFSRDIEVQTDVDVHLEARPAVPPKGEAKGPTWFDPTVTGATITESDEEKPMEKASWYRSCSS